MKHISKYLLATAMLITVQACNLDKFPYDAVSSGMMTETSSVSTATTGNYAMFKAFMTYMGFNTVGNTWIRHYYLMAELKSDNVLMSGKSTDPLFSDATLEDTAADTNIDYFWFISYKIAASTSAIINAVPDDVDDATIRHLKGENLFMRAVAHLGLCQIFAFPYSFGREETGVVIRTEPSDGTFRRASVGEVYDVIEQDLKDAIRLMSDSGRRGNNGYACKEAAQGLLSRVYLHEGKWAECVELVSEMLAGADPLSKLDPDYTHLFQFSKESPEVLWCIALNDTPVDYAGAQGMLGSMYFSQGDPGNGTGWAEIYYSQPLLDLFERYPYDQRYTSMCTKRNISDKGKKMVYWPVPGVDRYYENHIDREPEYNESTGTWFCKDQNGARHEILTKTVNSYPRRYILSDGQEQFVTLCDSMGCRTGTGGDMYPLNYMGKFSNMDGLPNSIASPIIVRWAEVILNRAEANAHLGNVDAALKDVNAIRERAGLTGDAQMSVDNMAERGYDDIIDLVLDERRMELCFEGFRTLDLQRNGKDIDRRYAGRQPYEIVARNDGRLRYYIPLTEINTSGIPQNTR